jgi:hypothetical protein
MDPRQRLRRVPRPRPPQRREFSAPPGNSPRRPTPRDEAFIGPGAERGAFDGERRQRRQGRRYRDRSVGGTGGPGPLGRFRKLIREALSSADLFFSSGSSSSAWPRSDGRRVESTGSPVISFRSANNLRSACIIEISLAILRERISKIQLYD